MVDILSLVGVSGSGKTTLLERLLPALARRGVRVAVAKHSHHAQLDPDETGKDTARLAAAGAVAVVGVAGEETLSVDALLARLPPCDLVLVEGGRSLRLPAIEVVGEDGARHDPATYGERVLVATAAPADPATPALPRDDVEGIASFLVGRRPLRRPGAAGG
ncbi:MAG: molybdopterin-guanine dinucleotide biosynthesis protein B [Planctomycetota bacterium JB042]